MMMRSTPRLSALGLAVISPMRFRSANRASPTSNSGAFSAATSSRRCADTRLRGRVQCGFRWCLLILQTRAIVLARAAVLLHERLDELRLHQLGPERPEYALFELSGRDGPGVCAGSLRKPGAAAQCSAPITVKEPPHRPQRIGPDRSRLLGRRGTPATRSGPLSNAVTLSHSCWFTMLNSGTSRVFTRFPG